LNKQHIVHC